MEKYKVGDYVVIKSLAWYNENKDLRGHISTGVRDTAISLDA